MPQDRLLHPKASRSQKVTSLTDFEYRVWTQYLLSADDFGVMRHSAVTLQGHNDALDAKPRKVVQRALDHLVKINLVSTFEHQGRTYTYQYDWQTWQKIEYPRATLEPKPPAETIAKCDDATREHFGIHPGGTRKKNSKDGPKDSENVSQKFSEGIPSNARARLRETANANGKRLTASTSADDLNDENGDPVAKFMRVIYPEVYARARHGATFKVNEPRDFPVCSQLVDTYGDRLPLILEYFLHMPPAKDVLNVPGSPRQLLHMAPQCDAELRQAGK